MDRTTGRIKQTKTGNKGMRRFAVEPELLPLLRAMHADANGQGPVVDMRQQKWWAADLRKHLELAGITREALFDTDDTRKRLRFHDLRGTGLTWMAIRGDDPLKIQQRAGHRTFEMTQKYIRTAEAVGEVIGATFPPLPDCLVAGRYRQSNRPSDVQPIESIVDTIATNSNHSTRRGGLCALTICEVGGQHMLVQSVRSGRADRVSRPNHRLHACLDGLVPKADGSRLG